jgi:hypothetical protein
VVDWRTAQKRVHRGSADLSRMGHEPPGRVTQTGSDLSRWPRWIARWKRPCGVPCDVITMRRLGDGSEEVYEVGLALAAIGGLVR